MTTEVRPEAGTGQPVEVAREPSPPTGGQAVAAAGRRGAGLILLDVVVVLTLTGLALIGLATTFVSWQYLVVGMVAGALGVALTLSTMRMPLSVLVASVPIAVILFGGPVALREEGLGGGIPDLQTLADVMQGCFTGWGELLTTLPFVDVAGPPALVPYLLGFLGSTTALVLAVRTRGAGGPVLPLLVVLVAVLLLRRPEGGLLDWYPVAFAALAIIWVVVRGLEFSEDSGTARGGAQGRVRRALTAALVVGAALAVAVPLTSGSPSSVGKSLRGQVGGLPDVEGLDSPLRRFRTFTEQPDPSSENVNKKLLFTVSGAPAGSRVRMLTLDRYDGTEWHPGNDTMQGATDDAFLRMDTLVDNPNRGRRIRAQVAIAKAYESAWVPTVGSLTSLRFLFTDADSRRSELRYNLATSTALVPVGIERGNDYEFTAIVPDQRLNREMAAWSGPVLHVEGADRADPLIRRVLASPAPPMRKVFVLARYLRVEGRYSNGGPGEARYKPGHDLDRLIDGFLLAPRPVGDDEQYAAAMALLANRVGVPARVVVGAVLPRNGKVRGKDMHAWVELRVADGTWRTLATREFMGNRPPQRNMTPARRPRVPISAVVQPPDAETAPLVQREQQAAEKADSARRSFLLRALPWLLLLLVALVVPVAKLTRRAVRRRRGRPSDRMAGAWQELVDHARDLGIPVRVHASRPAQARVLARAGGLSRDGDDGVFGEDEPGEEVVTAYWTQVMGERRQLGQGQPLRRRLWAPFNPTTFRRDSTGLD